MTWFRIRRKEKHHGVKQYKATPQELLTQSLIQEEPGQPVAETPTPELTPEPTPEPVATPAPISPIPAPAEPQISPAEINLEPALKLREEELQSNSFLKEHIIFCTLLAFPLLQLYIFVMAEQMIITFKQQ